MPNIAVFHPQIVHFVVALLIVGVVLRLLWLTGRVAFAGPAATTLIVAGTVAAVFAVTSGDQAHGPVERIPGAEQALDEHEELGERTRNLFLVVAALELAALAPAVRKYHRPILIGSAVLGLVGLGFVYETAEHGGRLVYSYAGGVGTRSGESEDLDRLLLAGLYHRSIADRRAGRAVDAAALTTLMNDRFGNQYPVIRVLAIESLIHDQNQPRAALDELAQLEGESLFIQYRRMWLTADAYEALGHADSALATLKAHESEFQNSDYVERVAALEASLR